MTSMQLGLDRVWGGVKNETDYVAGLGRSLSERVGKLEQTVNRLSDAASNRRHKFTQTDSDIEDDGAICGTELD